MKKVFIVILILIIVLQLLVKNANSFTPNVLTLTKLKGLCIRADDLNKRGIEKSLKEISEYGYNTIFILVKTPEGQVIFPSKNFPVLTDTLPQIIEIAQKYNLKVYAYFPVMMDKNYGTKHPEDLMGNLGYEKNTYYISLLSKNYLNYIKLFISELLKFDIDGLVFDYIRYPNGSYDFSNSFVSLGKSNGIDMDYVKSVAYKTFIKPADWKTMFILYEKKDKDIVNWVNLRERVLKDVAIELKNYASQKRTNLKFGAFLVSRGYRYDSIETSPSIKKTYAYQKVNFSYFGDTFNGILDFVIPMIYLSSLEEKEDYVTVVTNKIKSLTKGNLETFVGVNPSGISLKDTELEIFNAYLYSSGVVLFRYPLFNMGDLILENPLEEGREVLYTVKNNLGNTRKEKTIFNDNFVPNAENEVIIKHFYKFYTLVFKVEDLSYFVNGERYSMDVSPIIRDSRTFVPVRFLGEAVGFKVSYDPKKKEVLLDNGNIILKIGSNIYKSFGNELSMDTAPFIENSRTFVPLRFVREAFNFKVDWDESTKSITIRGIIRVD
ncbi:stalk domain-containing protein [Caldisericum sp. AR60]|uniref:stalk domain-containing protein n=1 Tax=Caldisericum sp. AR60 TaxID=3397852 RepID=UPI0039FC8762